MKASKLIEELQKLIDERGDCPVFFGYDQGMHESCKYVKYESTIQRNAHSDLSPDISNVFVISEE